jgi:hypothetical protein
MKPKDLVYLLIAVVILMAAGYLAYTQLVPQKSSAQGVTVEIVGPITENYDSVALTGLTNADKVRDYSVPIDLGTGLNNQAVFGQ